MLMEQLTALAQVCDEDERDLIEKMTCAAANYVQAVIHMKTKSLNYAGRTGEDLRTAVEHADRERRSCHNALISCVDIVNRLCGFHRLPPIYTGSTARREYGDFAMQLTNEIFAQR